MIYEYEIIQERVGMNEPRLEDALTMMGKGGWRVHTVFQTGLLMRVLMEREKPDA